MPQTAPIRARDFKAGDGFSDMLQRVEIIVRGGNGAVFGLVTLYRFREQPRQQLRISWARHDPRVTLCGRRLRMVLAKIDDEFQSVMSHFEVNGVTGLRRPGPPA